MPCPQPFSGRHHPRDPKNEHSCSFSGFWPSFSHHHIQNPIWLPPPCPPNHFLAATTFATPKMSICAHFQGSGSHLAATMFETLSGRHHHALQPFSGCHHSHDLKMSICAYFWGSGHCLAATTIFKTPKMSICACFQGSEHSLAATTPT